MLHAGVSVTAATAARLITEIATRMTSSIVAVSRVHLVLRVGVVRWCIAVTSVVPVASRTIFASRVSPATPTSLATCIIVGLELGAMSTVTLVVMSTSATWRSFVRLSFQFIEPSLLLLQYLLFCLELLA